MLLRVTSNRFVTSFLISSFKYNPCRSANTYIDEDFARKNATKVNSDTSNTNLSSSGQFKQPTTFAKMLRHSKFVQLGGLKGRLLSGRIVDVVDDDLYVDYGGKFHAIVQRPQNKQRDQYVVGTVVSLRLQSWEMAARFLGASRHISLLESDAQLVGLLRRVDRTVRPRDKDIDLRYRPGDRQVPITAKREVL